jgi:hypothetical protein
LLTFGAQSAFSPPPLFLTGVQVQRAFDKRREAKAPKDPGVREAAKEYVAALCRDDADEVLRLLARGGRSCKYLRERVARDLCVAVEALKNKSGRRDGWFRVMVEEALVEKGLVNALPRRPVTRELLALILTQDGFERKSANNDSDSSVAVSGVALRQSLMQGLSGRGEGKKSAAGPEFELLGVADVKRISRIYDRPVFGVEFEQSLFVSNVPPSRSSESHFCNARKVFEKLSASFSFISPLRELVIAERESSDVELVFAGGAISASLRGKSAHFFGDLDCFFVSPSRDTNASSRFLERILNMFYDGGNSGALFERSEHCTTVRWPDNGEKYQFIHRVYPTAASVIGGFDLGICAVMLHDSLSRISCTHLGAWSNALNMNIVDTSRRSTSFEFRIAKYARRGVAMVFPGLDKSAVMMTQQPQPRLVQLHNLSIHVNIANASCPMIGHVPESHDYDDTDVALYPDLFLATRNWQLAVKGQIDKISIWGSEPHLRISPLFSRPLSSFVDRVDRPVIFPSCRKVTDFFRLLFGEEEGVAYMMAEMRGDAAEMTEVKARVEKKVAAVFSERSEALCGGPIWRVNSPSAQWTGSVSPIMEDARKVAVVFFRIFFFFFFFKKKIFFLVSLVLRGGAVSAAAGGSDGRRLRDYCVAAATLGGVATAAQRFADSDCAQSCPVAVSRIRRRGKRKKRAPLPLVRGLSIERRADESLRAMRGHLLLLRRVPAQPLAVSRRLVSRRGTTARRSGKRKNLNKPKPSFL